MQLYLPLCDTWVVYDNSGDEPHLVAALGFNQPPIIYNPDTFRIITRNQND